MIVRMKRSGSPRRRGAVGVFVAVMMVVMLGMAALTIDVGMMYRAREEAQIAADSAAVAAAWELLDVDRLKGTPDMTDEFASCRQEVQYYAALNPIVNVNPSVPISDIQIGYLHDLSIPDAPLSFTDPNDANTVHVTVRRDANANGPVSLFFASILGFSTADVSASAAAAFKDGVTGFQVTPETGNAGVLPMAMHVDAWRGMMDGTWSCGDNWIFDEETQTVSAGSDDINELNLFPGGGSVPLPPGNFGTIDIGSPDNSAADLARQIVHGITAEDLAWIGGELKLGPDGTLILNGDTGISAGIKEELASIIGLPRAIPLFSAVSGNGDNAEYTIVGFGGIRVLDVKLTGPMKYKRVIVQPAFVVDDSAITGPGSGSSYFVYRPVELVR